MVDVVKLSTLKGAEKYGTCNACHKRADESELYRFKFGNDENTTSVTLCRECVQQLAVKMWITWEGIKDD